MVYIVYGRAELAENRRDNALAELQETVSLADSLEAQVAQLQSESGQNKAVRERYGLVGPNQGYLILLHEHESEQQAAD